MKIDRSLTIIITCKTHLIATFEQGGVPLKHDPFFQHIKNNRLAREILFSPNSEFTASKIVDIALRQDIGPDPSVAQDKTKALHAHQMNNYHKTQ